MDIKKIEEKIEILNAEAVRLLKGGWYEESSSKFFKIVLLLESVDRIEKTLVTEEIL